VPSTNNGIEHARGSVGRSVLVIDDSPTILKVVELVLTKAGYRVRVALDGEEGIKKAMEEKPSLILLDFVMPRLNGYQVCRALGDSIDLRDVPVVLMSAKGDQVGERFVKVMGIVDYITKPFSPEAITAVVEHTLDKARRSHTADGDATAPGETDEEDHIATNELAEQAEDPLDDLDEDPTMRRRGALARVRQGLVSAAADQADGGPLADKLAELLTDDLLARVIDPYAADLQRNEAQGALQGHLGRVPIAEVLVLLREQRQSGVLSVARHPDADLTQGPSGTHIDVYWKSGRIELATGEGMSDEFLIGRYLVDQGAISKQDFDLFLSSRGAGEVRGTARPIGEQMVRLNYVSEAELKQALARQSAERVYELMRWPSGRFLFRATRELPPLAIDAALGLDLDVLLIEGFRRVDEWHLIEREVDDFDQVFLRNEEAVQHVGKAKLTREELQVLDLITGKNSVKDVVRLSRMSSFDVSKLLFRLLSIKLIRRKVAPVAM
jgi:DNA-binding response OmpR family regulator